jgi:SAM-dependent methyltransferase
MIPWSLRDVTLDRWRQAQQHEARFWKQHAALAPQQNRVASRYAGLIGEIVLNGRGGSAGTQRLTLEVGSGPTCATQGLNGARHVFLDPLMRVYRPLCTDVPGSFVGAVGERLPFADATFDAVLSFNVIDHVISPAAFVNEMIRVAAPGGLLVLGVYTHPRLFAAVRNALERTLPWAREEAHPFFFSRHSLVRLMQHSGLEVDRVACVHAPARNPGLHRQDWVAFARKAAA